MSKKEKPLPRPPRRPFGPGGRPGKRSEEPEQGREGSPSANNRLADDLLADEMYGAMAGGELEEFLKKKFGGSEQAMKLAELMLGLSGMIPPGPQDMKVSSGAGVQREEAPTSGELTAKAPPEIIEAAGRGDTDALIGLLKKEQEKLSAAVKPGIRKKGKRKLMEPAGKPGRHMEKAVLEQIARIASENGVSLDWVVARALALYVRDYLSTGRL